MKSNGPGSPALLSTTIRGTDRFRPREEMTMDRPMSAFVLSATLHGVVIAILLLLSYAASQQVNPARPILELVAGAGHNYGARVAPKLGTPDGVKFDVPPTPKAEPREAL